MKGIGFSLPKQTNGGRV